MSAHDARLVNLLVWSMLAFAIAVICIAAYMAVARWKMVENFRTTMGKIVGHRKFTRGPTGERQEYIAPVVQFTLRAGKTVEFVNAITSRSYEAGAEVRVWYDPADPASARIASKFRTFLPPFFLFAFGLAWLAVLLQVMPHLPGSRSVAAPASARLDGFVGLWRNEDPKTDGITQLEIHAHGRGLTVNMSGKCHPADCDWGVPESIDLSDSGLGVVHVVWHPPFAIRKQDLNLVAADRLEVVTDTRFTDQSGRPSRRRSEYFRKN